MGGFASLALGGNFMAGVLLAGSLALIGISIVLFHDELKKHELKKRSQK